MITHTKDSVSQNRDDPSPLHDGLRYPAAACALASLAVGAVFGSAVSLSNQLASPIEPDSFARVPSLILDAGWAWAALAVAVGWLTGGPARGALSGALALIAAAAAYYATDSLLRDEPFTWYVREMVRWWLAGAMLGSLLGGVGAYARRSDAVGVLARLVVPAGSAVQMVILPPSGDTKAGLVRLIVLAGAGASAAIIVARFRAGNAVAAGMTWVESSAAQQA